MLGPTLFFFLLDCVPSNFSKSWQKKEQYITALENNTNICAPNSVWADSIKLLQSRNLFRTISGLISLILIMHAK